MVSRASVRSDDELEATEGWFLRQGLPMFIEEYDNGRDVWTRAVPALVVVFLLNTVVSVPALGFTYTTDTGADIKYDAARAIGALVTLIGLAIVYVVQNLVRGRRPLALPDRVGWPVLAVWLVVPSFIIQASTGDTGLSVSTFILNFVLLILIWVFTRYALLAQTSWALRRLARQMGDVYRLATRALPLLLLVMTVLFLNTELWQTAGTMSGGVLLASIAFFGILTFTFILGQVGEEISHLELELDDDEVRNACRTTPMEQAAMRLPALGESVPFSRRQRINLVTVMSISRLVQVLIVAGLVWLFFIGFGVVAVSLPVQQLWLGSLSVISAHADAFDGHGVTPELLDVVTFLAAFAAFYVTVSGATDPQYRENFFRGLSEAFTRSVSVRRAYLAERRLRGLSAPAPMVSDLG